MHSDTQSFIIRIWDEAVDDEGQVVTWRGSIDHVGSGKRLYFCDLDGIGRFIQEQARLNPGPGPRWKSLQAWIKHIIT